MFRRSEIPATEVHDTLRRHMLVDGYPIVIDLVNSQESWIRDHITGTLYLDFFSFFASNPIGMNHSSMLDPDVTERLAKVAVQKVSNADYYTKFMAEFVDTLARTAAPPELPHYFFVDGGALAVENAMKAAFDWKVKKNRAAGKQGDKGSQILHFEGAFHGRSGYTLSVTNTDPVKTDLFPKFPWPRVSAPGITFPLEGENLERVKQAEARSIAEIERAFDDNPDDIAAILIEPIQAEGGDHHFRAEFLHQLRRIANEREALLIFDEVQTGMGLTGKWWAFSHFGVVPDILCFAKKMQVGGIFVGPRIDEVPDNVFQVPSRINSTFGASLTDMVRVTHILEVIVNENLLDNARVRGAELLAGLTAIQEAHPGVVTNARGRGLMCAIDLPTTELRNKVVQRCFEDKMIVLKCGSRSVRFRPTLTVTADAIEEGVRRLGQAISEALA
ncbi:MAG: L-lysine 6-transaminase [Myxococcales bacterium]|nr:L-lysine 6-transaminase [Myxococcales bacterium]